MPPTHYRSSRQRGVFRAAIAAFCFLSICATALFSTAARAEQPFKLESEAGEVIDFNGKTSAGQVFTAPSEIEPILPLPVKEKTAPPPKQPVPAPSRPIENKPAQIVITPEVEFKRAKPSVIKKTEPVKTAETKPGKDVPKKNEKASKPDTEKAAAPPAAENTAPPKSKNTDKPAPAVSGGANEKRPPLPLIRGVSFSLSSESIEYNWRTKTLRAKSGYYAQSGITITANEIRIDLSKGLLAATGNVALYFSSSMAMKGHNYVGESLLYNLQTMEAAVSADSGTSYLSPVETASASGLSDDSFMGSVSLYPSASAPSLEGAAGVEYSGSGEDVIKSRSLSLTEDAGITFLSAEYIEAGKSHKLPSFQTRSGELRQKTYNINNLSTRHTPSERKYSIDGAFSYYLNDDPHRQMILDDSESITYSKGTPNHKNSFFRGLSKRAVSGNNILTLALSTQKANYTSGYASYKRYWFPDSKSSVSFSYGKYFRDMTVKSSNSYTDRYTNAAIAAVRNTRNFVFNASASSRKGYYDYDDFSDITLKGLTGYPNYNYSINNYELTIYEKPARIAGRRLYIYNMFDYSKNLIFTDDTGNPGMSGIRFWGYRYQTIYLDYKSGLSSGQIRLAGNLHGTARVEYELYSSKISLFSNNGWYSDVKNTKTYEARGIAGLNWKFSGKGVAGADYVWNRKSRRGYSIITPYLSYAGSARWNARLSGRYHEEMTAGKDIFAGNRLLNEMLDISVKFSRNSTLQASWDLDNALHGVTLYSLDFKSDSRKGLAVFSVSKYTTSSSSYSYSGNVLITTTTNTTPYKYSLSYYPK